MTAVTERRCVILFARAPEKGRVKSRLALHVDEDLVLQLYKNMVLDTIDALRSGHFPFRIFFTPSNARDAMTKWLGHAHLLVPQTGTDLGERMEAAFASVFSEGVDEALLIGSDIPGLTARIIEEAFISLATKDAVIGPAHDGGYYLIGFRRKTFDSGIFHPLVWGARTVYRETLDRLHGSSLAVHLLPELTDIDSVEDLRVLLSRAGNPAPGGSRTFSFLMQHRNNIVK